MKSIFSFSAILFLFFIGISCSNSDDNNSTPTPTPTPVITTFAATLTPPAGVTSSASGSAALTLNQTAKTFSITVNYTGLTPNAGHIHNATGGIEIPFTNVSTSPFTVSGSITDAQMTELLANHYYVNLHTTAYPNGEISGTLMKTGTSGGGGGGGGGGY
ncbi:CHRD domain-containing protein [Flavobacterium aestivum]|uniref:CHRD domain-containing protein n=1 Tax=Flavobacterium aestivum TaxID=3003257 RepID=UPI00228682D7|nr:CHRD domain-containing protein [Flavobacterium aestivum]